MVGNKSNWSLTLNCPSRYIRCMYLATKMATSIGNNPDPTNLPEYIMTIYWLSGVFVFAMLIGQIFQAASASKTKYRRTMDDTLDYMYQLNLPKDLQNKVRLWFNYTWERQKAILTTIPRSWLTSVGIPLTYWKSWLMSSWCVIFFNSPSHKRTFCKNRLQSGYVIEFSGTVW